MTTFAFILQPNEEWKMEQAPEAVLPEGTPLKLSDDNIELIARLAGFDVGKVFTDVNKFNKEDMNYPSFVFCADTRKEREAAPQRIFRLRAIMHYESDLNLLVETIRRSEPKSAVRVIQLWHDKLRSAIDYDPLDGTPTSEVPVSL